MKIRHAGMTLLVWLCSSSVGFAQDYEIRLTRPDKVGERYRATVSTRTVRKMAMSAGGRVLRRESEAFTLELVTDVTVLAIDKRKEASKMSLKIIKLNRVEGEDRKELLPKGTIVVTAIEEGKQVFRIGERKVDKPLEGALSTLVELRTGEVTDDETFGTPDRKKVGDSWPINRESAAREFAAQGTPAAAENIKGKTALEKAVKVGDVECLQIRRDVRVKDLKGPAPRGWRMRQSKARMVVTDLIPVDVEEPGLETGFVGRVQFQFVGQPEPDAQEVFLDASIDENKSAKRSEIPAEAGEKKE